jgi:hypothetical protein
MVPRTWGKLWRQAKGKRNRTILRRRKTTVTHDDEYAFNFVTSFLEMSELLGGDTQSRFGSLFQQRYSETANRLLEIIYEWITSYEVLLTFTSLAAVFLLLPRFPSRISELKWTWERRRSRDWSAHVYRTRYLRFYAGHASHFNGLNAT